MIMLNLNDRNNKYIFYNSALEFLYRFVFPTACDLPFPPVAEGERKLYLAIESTAELSVQKAKVIIFRKRLPSHETMF